MQAAADSSEPVQTLVQLQHLADNLVLTGPQPVQLANGRQKKKRNKEKAAVSAAIGDRHGAGPDTGLSGKQNHENAAAGRNGKKVTFIMLNPSTATEIQNDPTVERCERRARALGFGAFRVTNIFAWRDTDPRAMRKAAEPNGPDNDAAILDAARWADTIVAAWGTHGEHLNRGPTVELLLRATNLPLHHLGLTKPGHPKHPLYIAYAVQPADWDN